ncbi:hypothetical protein [Pseudomonas reinekei]
MGADSLAGLEWLFGLFDGALDFLIVATAPFFSALGKSINAWLPAVGFIALIIALIRLPADGPFKAIFSTAAIFLVITYGLSPTTLTLTGGSTIEATHGQRIAYSLVMSFNRTLNATLNNTMAEMHVDGAFIPTSALIQYSVERSANEYANSDLARLIRDYNGQCSPSPRAIRDYADGTSIEAYHAVGLLGGSGLGIPDEKISRIAQMKIAGQGAKEIIGSMPWTQIQTMQNMANSILDAGSVRDRRAEGISALEKDAKPFVTARAYALPTREYWTAIASGNPESNPSYLKINDAPAELATKMINNVAAWQPEEGGKEAALGYAPKNCVEAYQVAQFASEQAYNGLVETGSVKASGGQNIDSDTGVLAAQKAWMRVQQATFAGGEKVAPSSLNAIVSGTMATWQMGKNAVAWLELPTLLPMFVGAMAGIFWLVLITGPIAFLLSPLRGFHSLTSWLSMLVFPVLCILFAHLIAVSSSVVMSSAALAQAASAAGWQGGGADIDMVYGMIQMVFGVLLLTATWLATKLTGVSVTAILGAARAQAVTAPQAIKATADLVTSLAGYKKAALKFASQAGPSGKNNGGGGGGGGSGSKGRAVVLNPAPRQYTRGSDRGSYSGPSLNPKRTSIDNSRPASNANKFAQGRTPRSQKTRSPKDHDDQT